MTRPADIKDAVRYFTQTIFTKLIQENAQLLKGRTYRQIYRIGIGDLSEVLPCRLKRNVQRPYCSWEITVFKMGCFGRQEPIAPGHQLEEQSERGQRFFYICWFNWWERGANNFGFIDYALQLFACVTVRAAVPNYCGWGEYAVNNGYVELTEDASFYLTFLELS